MWDTCDSLLRFLEEQGVEFEVKPVGSVPCLQGQQRPFATIDTCIVCVDSELALAALSSDATLDLELLADELATRAPVRIVSADEVRRSYPGWNPEALPPLGNLFGLLVYISEDLAQEERIAFHVGDGERVVHMSYVDFEHIVKPCEVPLCAQDLFSRHDLSTKDGVSATLS